MSVVNGSENKLRLLKQLLAELPVNQSPERFSIRPIISTGEAAPTK